MPKNSSTPITFNECRILSMHSRRNVIKIVLVALFVLAQITSAHATTLLYKNAEDLVSEADGIVVGTVQKAESHYGPGKDIYTFVTLTELNAVYGDYKRNTLVLRLKGGEVDGDRLYVHGSPALKPNDRVVLFLNGNGKQIMPLVGWTQGVFRITYDPETHQDIITDHDGNRIFGIKEKDIVKEHRYREEAHIVGTKSFSQAASGHAGVTETGEIPEMKTGQVTGAPLPAAEFMNAIGKILKEKGKPPVEVKSVQVLDFSNAVAEQKDAAPPAPGQQ